MGKRDYRKILFIEDKEFVTPHGTWHATVSEYPVAVPAAAGLLHSRIDFELAKNRTRSLDLWIEDAADVTLVAESVGMLAAINRWLEESDGDDELLYDSCYRKIGSVFKRLEQRRYLTQ
jgi:hypothetical protein